MYVLELAGQDDAFAAREAASAATDVERLAPGLATARGLDAGVVTLALTHRASAFVGTGDPTVTDARRVLEAAAIDHSGIVDREDTDDRSGTVAVRAVDVRGTTGVDTQAAERALGDVLVDRGFAVDLDDPDHVLRALFSSGAGGDANRNADADWNADAEEGVGAGVVALGWLARETVRDYGDRQPTDRPYFQPGSMDPLEARAIANIAGARSGARLLDPFCGTGGILIEAALVGADVVGGDAQERMVRGSARNLTYALAGAGQPRDERYPDPGDWDVYLGDGAKFPIRDGAVDAVVFDAPYGRQSRIEGDLEALVGDGLAEARRVAPRAVLVADRSWEGAAVDGGWTVADRFERRVHRSLARHVHVLE